MKVVLIILALLTPFLPQLAVGQQSLACDSLHSFFESLHSNHIGLMYYDIPPELVGGYNQFYEEIAEQTQASEIDAKVYVRFIIDTLGDVQCAMVVKSGDDSLNEKAIELIRIAKFIPAQQQGKALYSSMVLPITFGAKPMGKKERKHRREKKH